MVPDLWTLYAEMKRSRLFELAIAQLWEDGLISGEMHLGVGEEAIIGGIVSQLREDDALALDHRGTAALLLRGIDPVLILRELLGHPQGLCGGQGGHMHLFSKEHLCASSGIVGAAGPAAAGFALAAQYLRPQSIAVAFFGEGAINQGMLLEAMNLAAVWMLPVLFVCKDDSWAITSRSSEFTGGTLNERARGFGILYKEIDGFDVAMVWHAARQAIEFIRDGHGPYFLHVHCVHLEAHFLGYQLLRATRDPLREMPRIALPLTRALLHTRGASLRERRDGTNIVIAALTDTLRDPRRSTAYDPIERTRNLLIADADRLNDLEQQIEREVENVLAASLTEETS
jgi:TPP-dependent pyruvate/acetoin dehydrogenase alpha subunit